jgi:heme/copper-type cytochrome/quinol oxidase subunit 4
LTPDKLLNVWLLSFVFGIILTVSNFAVAETMSFQNHNFTIEVPPTWTAINPTPPGTLFAMQSSDGEKVFFANALSVSENKNASEGLSMMIAGFKKARIDNNYQIVAERRQTLNNFSFTVFTSQASDKKETQTTWFASTAAEIYILGGIHKAGDANTDQELLSIISSFHLLSPAQTISHNNQINSMAFWFGCIFGVVIVVVFFIRRKNSKN